MEGANVYVKIQACDSHIQRLDMATTSIIINNNTAEAVQADHAL
jgi:hypothetical protein